MFHYLHLHFSLSFLLTQDLKFKLPKVSSSGFRVFVRERLPWKLKQVTIKPFSCSLSLIMIIIVAIIMIIIMWLINIQTFLAPSNFVLYLQIYTFRSRMLLTTYNLLLIKFKKLKQIVISLLDKKLARYFDI